MLKEMQHFAPRDISKAGHRVLSGMYSKDHRNSGELRHDVVKEGLAGRGSTWIHGSKLWTQKILHGESISVRSIHTCFYRSWFLMQFLMELFLFALLSFSDLKITSPIFFPSSKISLLCGCGALYISSWQRERSRDTAERQANHDYPLGLSRFVAWHAECMQPLHTKSLCHWSPGDGRETRLNW